MKKRYIGLITCLAILIVVSPVVGFGLFGFGESDVANQTYVFDGCSFEIPEDATVFNTSDEESGFSGITYFITFDENTMLQFDVMKGLNVVDSAEDYAANWAADGVVAEGKYGQWMILNFKNVESDDKATYPDYSLVYHDGTRLYDLGGNDLNQLKRVADTFKQV